MLVVDLPSGRIVSANERAHEIWGAGPPLTIPEGDASGLLAFRPDGTRYRDDEWPVARLVRTGRHVRDEEIAIRFLDGRRLVVLVNAIPVHVQGVEHEGSLAGGIVTFVDITERRAMEEELRLAKSGAEAADRAKSLFMSTLSHEFRTPLNGILGYAALLRDDPRLDEGQIRKLERIQAAVSHLNAMIDEILGLAGRGGPEPPEIGRAHV